MKKILTIAGSDSIGGAGIQADIKTITALKCYAMSAITALTAQNTTGVFGVNEVDEAFAILRPMRQKSVWSGAKSSSKLSPKSCNFTTQKT